MTTARMVRCHTCGAPQRASEAECLECGATFRGLCHCGAEVGLYDDDCAACGLAVDGPRLPLGRHPAVTAARWVVGLAVVVVLGYFAFRPKVVEPWRVRDRALRLMDSLQYREAARAFDELLELRPSDRHALVNLAVCRTRLGRSPGSCLEPIEAVLAVHPDTGRALLLGAVLERRRGNGLQAAAYAARATALPDASPAAHRLRALLELDTPVPDLAVAARHLRLALRAGEADPELRLRLAETLLRMHRRPGGAAPDTLLIDLERALEVLDGPEPRVRVQRTRLLLALRRNDDAVQAADAALAELPPDAPAERKAELQLLRARGYYGRAATTPNRELAVTRAVAEFSNALRATRDLPAAVEVAETLAAGGDADRAELLLAELVADGDPNGAFAAAHAGVLAELDRTPEALAAVRSAREAAPEEPRYLLLEARLLERAERFDEALERVDEALGLDATLVGARIARPLLEARRRPADPETLAQARRVLEDLRTELGDHPDLLKGLARVELADGRRDAAREALEGAVAAAPSDGESWLLLAAACDGAAQAGRRARAYAAARRLRGGDPSLRRMEIEAWLAAGDALSATLQCTEGLEAAPDDVALLRQRARANQVLGRWDQVRRDLGRVRDLGGGGDDLLLRLVQAEVNAGRRTEALALIEETLPKVEGDVRTLLLVMRARETGGAAAALAAAAEAGASLVLADLQLAHGRVDGAVATLMEVREKRPRDVRVVVVLASALLENKSADDPATRRVVSGLGADMPAGVRAFVLGRVALAEGRLADARTQLAIAAAELPDEPLVLLAAGDAAVRGGDVDQGLAWLRRAALLPGTTRAPRLTAERLVAASRLPELAGTAESLLREALAVDADFDEAAIRLAALLAARGAFQQAAEVAERGLARSATRETSPELVHRAAGARLASGRTDLALDLLRRLESARRASAQSALLRAYALIERGEHEAAEAVLGEVAEGELASLVVVGRARIRLDRDRDADAVRALASDWRAAHPGEDEVPLAIARLLLGRGYAEEALAEARLSRDGSAAFAATELTAAALRALGRPEEAVDEAEAFVRRASPDLHWESRLLHAELRLKLLGRNPRGAAQLAKGCGEADGVRPDTRVWASVLRAEALLADSHVQQAESAADRIEASWPERGGAPVQEARFEARVRFVLGVCALEAGLAQRAASQLEECLKLRPDDVAAEIGLAEALLRMEGEAFRAHEIGRRVTGQAPSNPEAWDTRAEAARRAGKFGDAETSWRKAQTLFSAAGGARRRARAASDLRFALFLRERERDDEARAVAKRVLQYTEDAEQSERARRFLGAE